MVEAWSEIGAQLLAIHKHSRSCCITSLTSLLLFALSVVPTAGPVNISECKPIILTVDTACVTQWLLHGGSNKHLVKGTHSVWRQRIVCSFLCRTQFFSTHALLCLQDPVEQAVPEENNNELAELERKHGRKHHGRHDSSEHMPGK
jgi:hypothetical protein